VSYGCALHKCNCQTTKWISIWGIPWGRSSLTLIENSTKSNQGAQLTYLSLYTQTPVWREFRLLFTTSHLPTCMRDKWSRRCVQINSAAIGIENFCAKREMKTCLIHTQIDKSEKGCIQTLYSAGWFLNALHACTGRICMYTVQCTLILTCTQIRVDSVQKVLSWWYRSLKWRRERLDRQFIAIKWDVVQIPPCWR